MEPSIQQSFSEWVAYDKPDAAVGGAPRKRAPAPSEDGALGAKHVRWVRIAERTLDPLNAEVAAAIAEVYGAARAAAAHPLVMQDVSFLLAGIPPPVAASLRKTICTELPGVFLYFEIEAVEVGDSCEPFMLPEFLLTVISSIPLRHGLRREEYADVEISLDEVNNTPEVRTVFSGDLRFSRGGKAFLPDAPFFNPSFQIAFVNPGQSLRISKIKVEESTGRRFSGAQLACCGRLAYPSLAKLAAERRATGERGADRLSRFDELNGLCDAKNYPEVQVSVTVPAALRGSQEARKLPARACAALLMRLRVIKTVVERGAGAGSEGSLWTVKVLQGEEPMAAGTLLLHNETETTTEIIKHFLAAVPGLSYVGVAKKVEGSTIQMEVRRRGAAEDLTATVLGAISDSMLLFSQLLEEFEP